jgi:protein-L-isoaspartate(D-aspartate) O-methyltransferase
MKTLSLLIMISLFGFNGNSQDFQKDDYYNERVKMVNSQLKARGLKNKQVLKAMENVPRHLFVPQKLQHLAYGDYPLEIGEGQTISQPYIVGFMTEALEPDSTYRVLEIGTGSGYQAAILGEICDSVFSIEIFESLGNSASKVIHGLGYQNIQIKIGDGYKGWPEKAPFDAIIVTCSPTHIPDPLTEQLKDGGKMIIPVGHSYQQELILLQKESGKLKKKKVLPVRFVPMIDEQGAKY